MTGRWGNREKPQPLLNWEKDKKSLSPEKNEHPNLQSRRNPVRHHIGGTPLGCIEN
jgi:hypothetical protein